MKLSISLSDTLDAPLRAAIRTLGGLPISVLIEAAVADFLEKDRDSQFRLVRVRLADRAAVTRDGWSRSFWKLLGHEMGVEDQQENELAPRSYGDYVVVMLLPAANRYPDENDAFLIHSTSTTAGITGRSTFTFERGVTPSSAAKGVADWLRIQRKINESGAANRASR